MAQKSRAELKSFFQTGDIPNESNYVDLIDSFFSITGGNSGSLVLTGSIFLTGSNGNLTASNVSVLDNLITNNLQATTIGATTFTGSIDFDLQNMANVAIGSGNINNTVIGNSTPNAGTFTTLASINGTSFGNSVDDRHFFIGGVTGSSFLVQDVNGNGDLYAHEIIVGDRSSNSNALTISTSGSLFTTSSIGIGTSAGLSAAYGKDVSLHISNSHPRLFMEAAVGAPSIQFVSNVSLAGALAFMEGAPTQSSAQWGSEFRVAYRPGNTGKPFSIDNLAKASDGTVTTNRILQIFSGSTAQALNISGSRVGILTENPQDTLGVSGNISASGGITASTINTGQGSNELYAMNQDVRTTDNVAFANITGTGNLNIGTGGITAMHLFNGNISQSNGIYRFSGSSATQATGEADQHHTIIGGGLINTRTVSASNRIISPQITASGTEAAGEVNLVILNDSGDQNPATAAGIEFQLGGQIVGAGQEQPSPAGKIISIKEDNYTDNVNVNSQLQFYTVSEHTSSLRLAISSSGDISASGVITAQNLRLPGFSDVSASLAAAVAGGDDLGNHTATQDIRMNGFDITRVPSASGVSVSGGPNELHLANHGRFTVGNTGDVSSSISLRESGLELFSGEGGITASLGKVLISSDGNISNIGPTGVSTTQITASANISASGLVLGAQGRFSTRVITNQINEFTSGQGIVLDNNVTLSSHLTASGNISASAQSTASFGVIRSADQKLLFNDSANSAPGGDIFNVILSGSHSQLFIGDVEENSNGTRFVINDGASTVLLESVGNPGRSLLHVSGNIFTDKHITASGNISASGDITASNIHIPTGGQINFPDVSFPQYIISEGAEILKISGSQNFKFDTKDGHLAIGNSAHNIAQSGMTVKGLISGSSGIDLNGDITTTGAISASGIISSSTSVAGTNFIHPINSTTSQDLATSAEYSVNGSKVEVRAITAAQINDGTFTTFKLLNTSIATNSIILGSFTGTHAESTISGSIISVATIAASTASVFIHNETGTNIAADTAFTASFVIF